MTGQRVRRQIVRRLDGPLVSVLMVASVSGALFLLQAWLLPPMVLYILVVFPIAILWGTRVAVFSAVLSAVLYDYLFFRPQGSFNLADSRPLFGLGVFLFTAIVAGELTGRLRRAVRQAQEQAALRRVATLVAQGATPSEVFSAAAEELGNELEASVTSVLRNEDDGSVTVVGGWAKGGAPLPVGARLTASGQDDAAAAPETGAEARTPSSDGLPASVAPAFRKLGVTAAVGSPVVVDERPWGIVIAGFPDDGALPARAEHRMADFTKLVATMVSNTVSNTQARTDLRRIAEEQAALRRVATLVARGVPPEQMFAAVTAEVGGLLGCDYTLMSRYDSYDAATVVGAWATPGVRVPVPPGRSLPLGERNVHTLVFRTRRPARVDSYGPDAGAAPATALAAGMQSAVGAPIAAEGRLWGVIIAASRAALLPADTEARLADFTDLVATAVANAESQAQLIASRARIVATADTTRRQIERDLHDGVQQYLISLGVMTRAARAELPASAGETGPLLDDIAEGLNGAAKELRELTRGLHPVALAEGGLRPALKALARRSSVPVRLDFSVEGRLPEPVELAAYYTVAEALTNVAKHASASVIDLRAVADEDMLRLKVRDDGRGGATVGSGSGLVGLTDRIEALGGRLTLQSPPGKGTALQVVLPLSLHEAADKLQYRRNSARVALGTGMAQTICFVSDTVASSSLAGDLINGALDAARERGALLFIGETGGEDDVTVGLLHAMRDRGVDGIIFASMFTRMIEVPPTLTTGPAVLLNALAQGSSRIPSVVPDEVEAGRAAGTLLLNAGHRDGIHLIGAGPSIRDVPPEALAGVERLTGISEVFDAAGIKIAGGCVCPDWQPEYGYEATKELLGRERPSALICLNDRLALGTYQALEDAGLEVPGHVSVVSFDDHPIATWIRPALTTVALPHYELGRTAVKVLFAEVDRHNSGAEPDSTVHRVSMPVRIRDSVAAPDAEGDLDGSRHPHV
jgi:DNA-binding LacI/PurR family transcriptional regulator/signal transduction histidine kinase